MTSPDPEKSPKHFGEIVSNPGTPSDLLDGSSGGLHIPVSNDSGFYGYNDEKHLQHVSIPAPGLPFPSGVIITQMGEKLFAQRRASTNSDGGKVAFKSGLGITMTSVTSVIEPNILAMAPSPFMKDEELKDEPETISGPGMHTVHLTLTPPAEFEPFQIQTRSLRNSFTSSKHSRNAFPSAINTCRCLSNDSVTILAITMANSTDWIPRSPMFQGCAQTRTSPRTLHWIRRINCRGPRTNLGVYTRNLHPHTGIGPLTQNPSMEVTRPGRIRRNLHLKNAKFPVIMTGGVLSSMRRECSRSMMPAVRQDIPSIPLAERFSCPGSDKKPAYTIPTIKEYFVDLEYVLGVISDGPTKSLAYRRLRYLASKFDMYYLLNEYKEVSDMKVSTVCPRLLL